MVQGTVSADREVVFPLDIQDRHGQWHSLSFTLDTGFNGQMTLPMLLIDALGLRREGNSPVVLGDGSTTRFDIFAATVRWDGVEREVTVHAAEGFPLIGIGMVYGYALYLHIVDGAPVVAVKLP